MSELNTEPDKKISGLTLGLIAAVVLLIIALAIVLMPGKKADNSASDETTSSETANTSNSSADTSNSICGAGTSEDKAVLDAAPTDTSWVSLPSGWIVPKSPTAGALAENNGVQNCFEHSPAGALYGSVWTFTQLNDVSTNKAAIENMLADSPGKKIAEQGNEALSNEIATLKGYKYINYSPDSATIKLLYSASTSAGQTDIELTVNMVWENGDWKMRVPDTGDMNMQKVSDTSSYIVWGN